jgi:aminopeptidase
MMPAPMSTLSVQRSALVRPFPKFDLVRLLRSVFTPTEGKRFCILIDLPDMKLAKDYAFLDDLKLQIQARAHKIFYLGLKEGGLAALGGTGV